MDIQNVRLHNLHHVLLPSGKQTLHSDCGSILVNKSEMSNVVKLVVATVGVAIDHYSQVARQPMKSASRF